MTKVLVLIFKSPFVIPPGVRNVGVPEPWRVEGGVDSSCCPFIVKTQKITIWVLNIELRRCSEEPESAEEELLRC